MFSARPLHDAVRLHVDWVTRRYPDAWFVGGCRSPEAVADLADRVYFRCDRVPLTRIPFGGRDPFDCYAEDQLSHRQIATLTFFTRRSITREVMRSDYEHNLVRDPVARWQAELFRAVGASLRRVAEPVPQPGRLPLWRAPGTSDRASRLDRAHLEELLRASRGSDLDERVKAVLGLAGAISQSSLASALQAIEPAPPPELEERGADSVELRVAVRQAVWAAWQQLDDAEQRVFAAMAHGATYAEIAGPDGAESLRKRLVTVSARLGAELGRALGDRAASVGPSELAELVVGVVQLVAPEVHP